MDSQQGDRPPDYSYGAALYSAASGICSLDTRNNGILHK